MREGPLKRRRVLPKMLVRMVALEGLQPMVTGALKGDNTQCGLGTVKKSNEEWKFWIVMIIVFNIIVLQQWPW